MKYLGNNGGKLEWGGNGFYSSSRNTSLDGHLLKTELKHGAKWVPAVLDLSSRFHLADGKWRFSDTDLPSGLITPPPPYTSSSSSSFRSYRETKKSSSSKTISRTSSFFQFKVSADKLSLRGSVLVHASSEIQLDNYIGIVSGRLIWGSKGFFKACGGRVSLNSYTLVVEFEKQKLELDLTRYLQFHCDKISLKVTGPSPELSRLLTEARWMKFKVITEPDVAEAAQGGKVIETTVQSLGETSKIVVAEMTKELVEIGSKEIMASVTEKVKTETTRSIAAMITVEIEKTLEKQIEAAFAVAKSTVMQTCKLMVKQAAEQVIVTKKDTVIGPLTATIVAQCRKTITETIKEVTETARTDFQERVVVSLESELIWASIRRAQTRAAFLEMMMMEEGYTLPNGKLQV
ncbi:hypothetical protein VKT23_008527 [Stygiomarasmius scandens]|uniref:Uncharacterized protein n=1 Tax=Marasmiellus scandens TaxID=2682957 RepID=A0ABR1JMT0_9AGAR